MPKSKVLPLAKKSFFPCRLSPYRGPGTGREAEGARAPAREGSFPTSDFINFMQGNPSCPPHPIPSLQS